MWMMKMPPGAEERLHAEADLMGVDSGRVVMSNLFKRDEHLKIKSGAGLFLDTMVRPMKRKRNRGLGSGYMLRLGSGDTRRYSSR